MRYLWLTWIDPQPERDGQRIYSGRLIDAVAATGAEVDVLCFAGDGESRSVNAEGGNVRWRRVVRARRPGWMSAFSCLPNVAYRCDTVDMHRSLDDLIGQGPQDAIVLDGLYTGWALPLIDRYRTDSGRPPRLVYVSHNHEESTRAAMARDFRGNPLVRKMLRRDADKARRLEHRMVDVADLVTAITPEDAERFQARRPEKHVVVLSPGYAGRRVAERIITDAAPRRVILLGSFGWLAKRMNLEAFLAVADSAFAAAGAELQIIGEGADEFAKRLRHSLRATEFVGAVPAIDPYLADARLAVIPEKTGGGFKLKMLDYVFHRLPVAALDGSVAGVPLRAPDTYLSFANFEELARGAIAALDDLPLLNRLQERAYAACAPLFDWRDRGRRFVAGMTAA